MEWKSSYSAEADDHQAAVRLGDRIRGDGFRLLAGVGERARGGIVANVHCLLLPKERSLPILEVTVMTRLLAALALLIALRASAQLIARRDLSYSMALAMATAALDACKARGYAVSVVVVDRGGDTMVAIRAD